MLRALWSSLFAGRRQAASRRSRRLVLDRLEDRTLPAAWTALDEANTAAIRTRLVASLAAFRKLKNPTEAETEKELIWPLLEALGWTEMSVQQNLSAKVL